MTIKSTQDERSVVKVERINDMWSYVLPDDKLVMGASYGNKKCFANSKASGAIENLFSNDLGRSVIGSTVLRYYDTESSVLLEQAGIGSFIIHPAYQKRKFSLTGDLRVTEIFYVPNAPGGDLNRCQAAYLGFKVRNKSKYERKLSVVAYADLCSPYLGTPPDLEMRYCYQGRSLVARSKSNHDWVKVFGSTADSVKCSFSSDISLATDNFNTEAAARACLDSGSGDSLIEPCVVETTQSARASEGTPASSISCDDVVIGSLQVDLQLPANREKAFTFIIGFSPNGEADAVATFDKLLDFESVYRATIDNFVKESNRSVVVTPEAIINRGVQWAKANMLRVKADYPQGTGFTNDPSMSSNIVARDTAWFAAGSDYVDPDFSKAALRVFKKYQQPTGMIVEYYNGVTGEVDDYQLNINDDTALYIIAVGHTYQMTGDKQFLQEMYPSVEKAADYIVSQMDTRGLVFCTATGVGVYGICGWRNVIPNYAINGAVTEVNSECFAALTGAALLADLMGKPHTASAYRREVRRLRNAINTHLVNPKNGLYYLNIDTAGHAHPDVTCDLIFPVIFNVAPPSTAHLIIDRLNRPDFLTSAGLRTVPRTALNYHPERGWGLVGGLWPDVAFMFAYACSKHQPDVTVSIMAGTFRQYELDPKNQNTVPGQFSEWYHGESLVTSGMKLSPWFPPKYLWTALEGVCGVSLYGGLNINPNMPLWWKWVSLANLSYQQRMISYFAARINGVLHIFATGSFTTDYHNASHTFDRDITDMIQERFDGIHVLALGTATHIVVCVGNITESSTSFTFYIDAIMHDYAAKSKYLIRVFHSEIDEWYGHGIKEYDNIEGFTVALEAGGFKVIELTAQKV